MPLTPYLILRKTPYMESSLIVSGISPDCGRLDFLLRGALKPGKKKFPFAVLFREITVDYRPPAGDSTLASLRSQDPLCIHDQLAGNTELYLGACDFAAFLLRNSRYQVPIPRTYCAVSRMFTQAEKALSPDPWLAYAKLVYLHENGLVSVPDDKSQILNAVFDFAEGKSEVPPRFSAEYLPRFLAWIKALAEHCST